MEVVAKRDKAYVKTLITLGAVNAAEYVALVLAYVIGAVVLGMGSELTVIALIFVFAAAGIATSVLLIIKTVGYLKIPVDAIYFLPETQEIDIFGTIYKLTLLSGAEIERRETAQGKEVKTGVIRVSFKDGGALRLRHVANPDNVRNKLKLLIAKAKRG